MNESKEMKMFKELLRDTVYGREFDILAFMANNTCEALTYLREWIEELKQQRNDLLAACEAAQIMLLQTDWNGDERLNIVHNAITKAKP